MRVKERAQKLAAGVVGPERREEIERVALRFAVALTDEMAALIDPSDPADPIAAQFLPSAREFDLAPEERQDPLGEERFSPCPGLVHRHRDRVLLKPILLCPVYCRFCFRREVVGKKGAMLSAGDLERAFAYIRDHREIWEVIVTGGDPFLLSPRRIGQIVETLDGLAHLEVIRFHTRVPVADPARVDARLLRALRAQKALFVVIHVNHPRELTEGANEAAKRFLRAGIPLLSQSVLLRGVNDDPVVLEALLRRLVAMRIKPYYLHHADLAPGTAHFRTGIEKGRRLVRALRGDLSGLCQPTYVLDIPGGYGKVPIGPCAIEREGKDWVVEDACGERHPYPADRGGDEE